MARYNPNNSDQLSRLRDAMRWSSKKLAPFRATYIDMLRQYVGKHYGDGGTKERVPVNLFRTAIDIYARKLAARSPNVLVRTKNNSVAADATELEIATNHILPKINILQALQEAVKSALFVMGIIKVGITPSGFDELEGYLHDGGQPFADSILFEDWLHDMTARREEEWDWCGNRYRVPLDMVKDNPLFDKKVSGNLQATDKGEEGDVFTEAKQRSSDLSQGETMIKDEYKDHIELYDIWLPRENLFITIPASGDSQPLRIVEWEGPAKGPYHLLKFSHVVGNIMGASPGQNLLDMHELTNILFNKLGRQAKAQKTVGFASGAAAQDGTAQRIMDAEDGQVVRCDDASAIKEVRFGGPDQQNMAMLIQCQTLFSYLGGNLNVAGGLRQEGGTLGQEELLKSSSSEMIQDMQDKTYEFSKGVLTDVSQYLYTDPFLELPLTKKIEGTDIVIPFTWGPAQRQASFFDYNLSVEPYSMQPQSPQQLLQSIMQTVTTVIMPMVPMMQQQGLSFDMVYFIELIAKLGNIPELTRLIDQGGAPLQIEGGDSQGSSMPKPASTNRNYTRTSTSTGGTATSRDNTLMQALMSGSSSATPQQMGQLAK